MLEGRKGADTSVIRPGVSAKLVESTLGAPRREWRNQNGVTFRLYEFNGGRPSFPGYALLAGVAAVGTLGVLEVPLANAVEEDKRAGTDFIPVRMIVSYDANDVVLGMFEEFDYLPADGHHAPGAPLAR